MIVTQPMLDESSGSHNARLAWINGRTLGDEIATLIRKTLTERGCNTAGLPYLYQLALVSNMDPMNYARNHSMLAAFLVAVKRGSEIPHGSVNAHKYARQFGMLTKRLGPYCCIKCIKEDIHTWSISWYHRKHHLIGVDWCHVHGDTLHQIDASFPLDHPPHIWLSEKRLVPVQACAAHLPEAGFLHRYVKIASALLDRTRPFNVEDISLSLAQRAKQHNLRVGKAGRGPLISDRLIELAPAEWLQEHLSEIGQKVPGMNFPCIDGLALSSRPAGLGSAYTMAIATLYDTAEDAMLDLSSADTADESDEPINTNGDASGGNSATLAQSCE